MLARFKELSKKYGKVALGVHFSVSAASISGIYVAIKNNVDVESMLHKIGVIKTPEITEIPSESQIQNEVVLVEGGEKKKRNRTAELVAESGGALTMAILLNKALFPVRVPITMVLTPAVARFLRSRNLIKNSGGGAGIV